MHFNVATLLQEPVGSRRDGRIEGEAMHVAAVGWDAVASGEVRLLRSTRGVLVHARIETAPLVECSRCLEPFRETVSLTIDEEFVAPYDPQTGEPAETLDEDDFRIDEQHHLDLSEAVRQYEQTAIPIQPICRPACAGLCAECGGNRNLAPCECAEAVAAGAWEALSALSERLHAAEESDGATEA